MDNSYRTRTPFSANERECKRVRERKRWSRRRDGGIGSKRNRKRDSVRANNARVLQGNSIFLLRLLRSNSRSNAQSIDYDAVEPSDFLVKEV